MAESTSNYLAVDLGGTKTALALYDSADTTYSPLVTGRYQNNRHGGVEEIIADFLSRHQLQPASVCICIAGIVGSNEAKVTNLPWIISKEALHRLGFSTVTMINDLTAVAAALPLLRAADLHCLKEGKAEGNVAAVLAPGTGLGEGYLIDTGNCFYPQGGEGGHADFGPVGADQQELLSWMRANHRTTISYEMVCSGLAVGTLYDFYLARGQHSSDEVQQQLAGAMDRTPVIIEAALADLCPVCRQVLELFLSILGRESANLVLKTFATRGLFFGGGILPRLVHRTSFEPLLQAFHLPGTMADLLATVPIKLIVRKDVALLGAASYGSRISRDNQAR